MHYEREKAHDKETVFFQGRILHLINEKAHFEGLSQAHFDEVEELREQNEILQAQVEEARHPGMPLHTSHSARDCTSMAPPPFAEGPPPTASRLLGSSVARLTSYLTSSRPTVTTSDSIALSEPGGREIKKEQKRKRVEFDEEEGPMVEDRQKVRRRILRCSREEQSAQMYHSRSKVSGHFRRVPDEAEGSSK